MLQIVRRLFIVTIVGLCLVTFAFAQASQTGPGRPGKRLPAAQAVKDYPEDHRPPVCFPGRLDGCNSRRADRLQRQRSGFPPAKQESAAWPVRIGAPKDVIYDRHPRPRAMIRANIWLGACAAGPCAITSERQDGLP